MKNRGEVENKQSHNGEAELLLQGFQKDILAFATITWLLTASNVHKGSGSCNPLPDNFFYSISPLDLNTSIKINKKKKKYPSLKILDY